MNVNPPRGPHYWTLGAELVTDSARGWVQRSPTGRGWGRCSCGERFEDPAGAPLPLDLVHMWLARHLAEARDNGEATPSW